MISIIVPILSKSIDTYLSYILEEVSKLKYTEVVIINGCESKGVKEKITTLDISYFELINSNRAERLHFGIKQSSGDTILLHHPRSVVKSSSITVLEKYRKNSWGGFKLQFDSNTLPYKMMAWYSNQIRAKKRIIYLDHCIFLTRDLANKISWPTEDIFEDTIISKELSKLCKPTLLSAVSLTSSIRFKTNGLVKQVSLNQLSKILFFLKIDNRLINSIYEKGLNLNKKRP